MARGLIDEALDAIRGAVEPRIPSVAVAEVIENIDTTGGARVKLRLPWLPGYEPWARVSAVFAGSDSGAFFIPQPGDEVLVAFNQGDVREPYVLGSLWNGQDGPPVDAPIDAVAKRVVVTPGGHRIELDDLEQSVKIETSTGQRVVLETAKIELETAKGAAKLTLETSGRVAISANTALEIKAPSIKLEGTNVEVKGTASGTFDGGASCTVKGAVVRIN